MRKLLTALALVAALMMENAFAGGKVYVPTDNE